MILQKSAGIENSDGIVWQLVVALSCAWLFVLAMVVRGIKVKTSLITLKASTKTNNFRSI